MLNNTNKKQIVVGLLFIFTEHLKLNQMEQIKELINENKNKKVLIFRSEDKSTKNGFNYYLTVLVWNAMHGGSWVINDNHKQKLDITSLKTAKRIATDLLNTNI